MCIVFACATAHSGAIIEFKEITDHDDKQSECSQVG